MEIQGNVQYSQYADERIETTGVVTLYTANEANFWLQDPSGDNNTKTSDGIFVAGGGFPSSGPRPAIGDFIRIIAKVQEQQFGNALPLTRLISVEEIEVLSSNNLLPQAVMLSLLPNQSIEEGIAFWEPLEGMLVQVEDAIVVSPTSGFGEFAMITQANRKLRSGFFKNNNHLLIRSLGDQQVDYNPERILVDDGSLDSAIISKPGDEMESLLGVVDYTFGNYKLQPVNYHLEQEDDEEHESGYAKREFHDKRNTRNHESHHKSHHKNRLTVATFNVENLFDLVDDPIKDDQSSTPTAEELETKLSKLSIAVADEMQSPDVVIVQEVENTAVLQQLADRVNALTMGNYQVASFETSDARGIEVGFMWNANRVTNTDVFQMTGLDVEVAFGPDSVSPGREPLVGVFTFNDEEFTIVGNHFKSKGGDDVLFGINQPPVRITETQRKLQARVVRDFVNGMFTTNPKANVIVAGDLNDFQFAEPGEGEDHPIAIIEGLAGEEPLFNLIREVKESERFSFIFDGNSQALDHMLVSSSLLEQMKHVRIRHFNASYPEVVSVDATTANRSSDHDPIVATFTLK
jgi:predicted extracellular nuclease